jgi:hypothetical protein
MLDICLNQAAGLAAMTPLVRPRLVAVASHGSQQGEMALLWSLCQYWVDMGQAVLVLDAHSHENPHNPGLLDLLNPARAAAWNQPDPHAWTVWPAAKGLIQLTASDQTLPTLGHLFQDYGVVLLYAPAAQLGQLLRGTGLSPLLVLPPLQSASVTAYRAIKQLLQQAQLQTTVASIHLQALAARPGGSPVQKLQACSQSFLGLTIAPIQVAAVASAQQSKQEISRLALQLLENAVMLERHPTERTH